MLGCIQQYVSKVLKGQQNLSLETISKIESIFENRIRQMSNIVELPNGRTVKEVYENVRKEVERIYLEAWKKGISVPFFDGKGNTFLVNPDGSEDLVLLDLHSRTYNIIRRTAVPGRTWWAMK